MKLAVIRIRGVRKIDPRIKRTLELMRLERPNHCVLVDDSPQTLGMLNVIKDYVTFGPISEEMIFAILMKKGKKDSSLLRVSLKDDGVKVVAKEIFGGKAVVDFANPVFRLRPPSKGYKDIKSPYPKGDLGRREDIAPLLKRMI